MNQTKPLLSLHRLVPVLFFAACGGATPVRSDVPDNPTGISETQSGASLNAGVSEFTVAGVRVLHKRTPATRIVSASVYFDGGATLWDDKSAGALNLALAVASEGGPDGMTKSDYSATLDAMGSSIGASTGFDYANFSMSCITSSFEPTWNLFTRTMRAPAFADDEIELSRQQHLASLRSEGDDPDASVALLARQAMYAGHPYANRPVGTLGNLERFTKQDLRSQYDRLFVKERMLVVVVGDVSREQVEGLVASSFSDVPSDPGWVSPVAPPITHHSCGVAVNGAELPTNYVLGIFSAPTMTDTDYPAMEIAINLLSDKLFEEVRTKRNLTYAVSASLSSREANSGTLYVTAADPSTTLPVMLQTVHDLESTPVTDKELADQIEVYLTHYYQGLQTNSAQSGALATWELLGGGRQGADTYVDRLRSVTPSDVAHVVTTYLSNIQWGVLGSPLDNPPQLYTGDANRCTSK